MLTGFNIIISSGAYGFWLLFECPARPLDASKASASSRKTSNIGQDAHTTVQGACGISFGHCGF